MTNFKEEFFLYAALVFFLVSLVLPGIVYQPRVEDNPRHAPQTLICEFAHRPGAACYQIIPGFPIDQADCETADSLRAMAPDFAAKIASSPVVTQDVIDYCGDDWDKPVSHIDFGFNVLALGWLGVFLANFAWYANIIMLIGVVRSIRAKKFRSALNYSILAVVLGFQAFMLNTVPMDEAGNYRTVDHLAIGYYMWEAALILVFVHCLLQVRKSNIQLDN
jgi:hypothetical protein